MLVTEGWLALTSPEFNPQYPVLHIHTAKYRVGTYAAVLAPLGYGQIQGDLKNVSSLLTSVTVFPPSPSTATRMHLGAVEEGGSLCGTRIPHAVQVGSAAALRRPAMAFSQYTSGIFLNRSNICPHIMSLP